MIEQQIRPWDVLDQRVLDTLADIAREKFVAESLRGIAYADYEIPIGYGQYMLKPNLDGRLLQALDLKTTDTVLEIGTGSGYLSACISRLCSHLDTLEIVPELAATATERLQQLGIGNIRVRNLDAAGEWDARDSYQAIVFTGSVPAIPDWYKQKMAIGGRLVAIVGDRSQPTMTACLLNRISADEWIQENQYETVAPQLLNFSPAPAEESPFNF